MAYSCNFHLPSDMIVQECKEKGKMFSFILFSILKNQTRNIESCYCTSATHARDKIVNNPGASGKLTNIRTKYLRDVLRPRNKWWTG